MPSSVSDDFIESAAELAAAWQRRANRLLTPAEKARRDMLRRLLDHPDDKITLVKLLDQSFRSSNAARVADQVTYLFRTHGIPDFFSLSEKVLMTLFRDVGRHIPSVSIPKMIARMRESSRPMIIDGRPEALNAYLRRRKAEGARVNLNRLGEAVLGETEAGRRLEAYVRDLRNPEIETISVKISTLYSQISPLAFDHDLEILCERLAILFRAAKENNYERADGSRAAKMVNLDMEAYRDMALTLAAFTRTLDRDEFADCTAGIVLQAYLPDAYLQQQALTQWALARIARGGRPVKIRLVKGANLEMEQVEAALTGWELATYDTKAAVDANFKRMILYGLEPRHIHAVELGIASHNLFDLAFAHQAAVEAGVQGRIVFEMLEGMADHVRRALVEQGVPVLSYAPVADEKEFLNAIAYLIRRMDENSGPENFLRHAPELTPRSVAWRTLQERFRAACERIDRTPSQPLRTQNRSTETFAPDMGSRFTGVFVNEPDTDFSLAPNRQWAERIRERWRKCSGDAPLEIPLVVAGRAISETPSMREMHDPNQWPERVMVARCAMAGIEQIAQATEAGRADPDGWRALTLDQRWAVLDRVAHGLRRARGDLIGAAAADTGKIFSEADVEVSEAIDFAEFYPWSVQALARRSNLALRGKGLGVVVSPWNFPIAIAAGGLLAALAAGNTVIFKPSSDALLVAWQLCRVFWEAGVSQNTLQFVPCPGDGAGQRLIGHPDVDFVILTGGTGTALTLLARRPDLFLAAETGGKNATIVTAMADRDQAVKNIVGSAFGHSGQKCSATSLLILEKELYDDPRFKQVLVDAAASLTVGPAWRFDTRIGPLIRPPAGVLARGLTQLERGERWALEPRQKGDNPHLWTPGIKWGVQPGSFTHTTELFGPVLGVMRASDLDEAVALANQTGYGLTAGLESLDPREADDWKATIRAGNLYINRGTTGAITLRQPFGGMGKSAVGPAIKAGGPDYVTQFMRIDETARPAPGIIREEHPLLALAQRWERKCRWGQLTGVRDDLERFSHAVRSYLHYAQSRFFTPRDYFHLRGQDNQLRYLPAGRLAVCVHPDDSLFEIAARLAAGVITGCQVVLACPVDLDNEAMRFLGGDEGRLLLAQAQVLHATAAELAEMVPRLDRLRYADARRVPAAVYAAAAQHGRYIAREPVFVDGRVELLHYLIGQSICDTYHRHGNLGERGLKRGPA